MLNRDLFYMSAVLTLYIINASDAMVDCIGAENRELCEQVENTMYDGDVINYMEWNKMTLEQKEVMRQNIVQRHNSYLSTPDE